MATHLDTLVVNARRPGELARFWATLLGWQITVDLPAEVAVPAPGDGWSLVFVPAPEPKTGKNPLHLDLASTSDQHQRKTVAHALSLGAHPIDIGQRDVPWTVLADPEGNEFCVLEPRTTYAGSGAVAAIVVDAQDPGRLARFWSPLAAWPITAEEPGITTLHNPSGRGPTLEFLRTETPKHGKNRLHLEVASTPDSNHATEVRRALDTGATLADIGQGNTPRAILTDPEGNEFCLRTPQQPSHSTPHSGEP
ncbi:VOC family protein [Amycolatopsis jejuensis]|uniref:VOC family protein n=1 Tax=Amycolatopsis jejuensis TaxID=330084 RepID=UPI00068B8907|nr:VOC family protein [Amycolatopsis jejuensis]